MNMRQKHTKHGNKHMQRKGKIAKIRCCVHYGLPCFDAIVKENFQLAQKNKANFHFFQKLTPSSI